MKATALNNCCWHIWWPGWSLNWKLKFCKCSASFLLPTAGPIESTWRYELLSLCTAVNSVKVMCKHWCADLGCDSFPYVFVFKIIMVNFNLPVPVAVGCEAQVFGRSPAEIMGSNPTGAWMSVCCECCVMSRREVSVTSWSLVQRSPTECGASLCVI